MVQSLTSGKKLHREKALSRHFDRLAFYESYVENYTHITGWLLPDIGRSVLISPICYIVDSIRVCVTQRMQYMRQDKYACVW